MEAQKQRDFLFFSLIWLVSYLFLLFSNTRTRTHARTHTHTRTSVTSCRAPVAAGGAALFSVHLCLQVNSVPSVCLLGPAASHSGMSNCLLAQAPHETHRRAAIHVQTQRRAQLHLSSYTPSTYL